MFRLSEFSCNWSIAIAIHLEKELLQGCHGFFKGSPSPESLPLSPYKPQRVLGLECLLKGSKVVPFLGSIFKFLRRK